MSLPPSLIMSSGWHSNLTKTNILYCQMTIRYFVYKRTAVKNFFYLLILKSEPYCWLESIHWILNIFLKSFRPSISSIHVSTSPSFFLELYHCIFDCPPSWRRLSALFFSAFIYSKCEEKRRSTKMMHAPVKEVPIQSSAVAQPSLWYLWTTGHLSF